MKFTLSAIAAGATLACACQLAHAQSTVTVTQQGNANTVSAEQVVPNPNDPSVPRAANATVIQIGNGNHAGGPGGRRAGIYQRDNVGTFALIQQNGTANNAGVMQDGTCGFAARVEASITQAGNANDATIRQHIVTSSPAIVEQTGSGNLPPWNRAAPT
jgi:hypothetical protein